MPVDRALEPREAKVRSRGGPPAGSDVLSTDHAPHPAKRPVRLAATALTGAGVVVVAVGRGDDFTLALGFGLLALGGLALAFALVAWGFGPQELAATRDALWVRAFGRWRGPVRWDDIAWVREHEQATRGGSRYRFLDVIAPGVGFKGGRRLPKQLDHHPRRRELRVVRLRLDDLGRSELFTFLARYLPPSTPMTEGMRRKIDETAGQATVAR